MAKRVNPGSKNGAYLRKGLAPYTRRLNDLYIEAQLSVQGLKWVLDDVRHLEKSGQKFFKISAPSALQPRRNIYREFGLVHELLRQRMDSKEYIQTIVFAVALTESYISGCLHAIIRAYPKKLLMSTKGAEAKDGTLSIDLRDFLNAESMESIISERATHRVREAGYANPETFFKYCKAIFGFEYSEALRKEYIEIKASRDIFVHNDGIVNEIYVEKSGDSSRAAVGDALPVDLAYFDKTIVCLKGITTATYRGLLEKFAQSEELNRVFEADAHQRTSTKPTP